MVKYTNCLLLLLSIFPIFDCEKHEDQSDSKIYRINLHSNENSEDLGDYSDTLPVLRIMRKATITGGSTNKDEKNKIINSEKSTENLDEITLTDILNITKSYEKKKTHKNHNDDNESDFKMASSDNNNNNNNNNKKILNRLGMYKIRYTGNNNNNYYQGKKLMNDMSKMKDDSKMYIVKLPPNPNYYTNLKQSEIKPSKHIPLNFNMNGKPGKIYHWNLPMMRKISKRKSDNKFDGTKSFKKHNNIQQGSSSGENNHLMKSKRLSDNSYGLNEKLSYYRPKFNEKPNVNLFPGNGKPYSLYVIKNHKKPHREKIILSDKDDSSSL